MEEPRFKLDVLFGHVALDTRWREQDGRLIGQSRKRTFDASGRLIETTEWTDTGCTVHFGDPVKPRAGWWERWKHRNDGRELRALAESCGVPVSSEHPFADDDMLVEVRVDGVKSTVRVRDLVIVYQKNKHADARMREASDLLKKAQAASK